MSTLMLIDDFLYKMKTKLMLIEDINDDPSLGNNKWYQSSLRSFDQKKNNTQVQQSLLSWPSQAQVQIMRVLERDVKVRDNKIKYLKDELEQIKKEKESLDNKLTGFENASKDLDNLLGSQRSDKNKEGLGYTAVHPPPAQIYSPAKKDLSWTSLPEFVDDTITDYRRPTTSIDASKCNKSEFQSSNFSVFEHGESTCSIMSKPMIKFVKEADCPGVIKINNTENARISTVKYAEMYRNISKGPKVRGNQRNWNNQKSQQLGNEFMMHNKACYICGSFDHLWYTGKQKRQLNGTREEKPVWNTAGRVNHQISPRITHPNLKRHMVPRKILTKSGTISLNTARQSHLNDVCCCCSRQVNTARPKAMINAVRTNRVNDVKASACWVWKPIKPNSASMTLKRYDYVDVRGRSCNGLGSQEGLIFLCEGKLKDKIRKFSKVK
nr:zf-CCHC domain-containing protein/UBN2 domain-containing protein [Tanacetum cinerariifolium]